MNRPKLNPSIVALLVGSLAILNLFAGEEKNLTSDELLALVSKREAMTLVTPKPVKMPEVVWKLCREPRPGELGHADFRENPDAHYSIFVTTSGATAMKDEKAVFPTGTVILKQKLAKKDDTTPLLYTGMFKREKGYNPDCGDWEFFVVSGDGKSITDRGKLKSCIDCHKPYASSDFVTKKYK